MYLTNQRMKVLSPGSPPVHALFQFFSKESVGRVSSSESVCCVSGILKVGQIGESIRIEELIRLSRLIRLLGLIRLSGLIQLIS